MKAITKATMTLAALSGLVGCAKENLCSPEKTLSGNTIVTLTADQENTGTKAAISSENSKLINWTKDDAITVIDGEGKNVKFTLKDGAGTSCNGSGGILLSADVMGLFKYGIRPGIPSCDKT